MSIETQHNPEQSRLDYSVIETPDFQEALKVVKENTKGKLWVMGGYLARAFARTDTSQGDIDFIAESLNKELKVTTERWKGRKRELFPGFKFDRTDGLSVDVSEIGQWKKDRSLPPTPESVLKLAPFTHMALMYDVRSKQLIGESGIQSMLNRQTRVNNIKEAEEYVRTVAKYGGMTVEQVLEQKARELNFKAIY